MSIRIFLSPLFIALFLTDLSSVQAQTFYKATGRYECEHDANVTSSSHDEFGYDCEVLHTTIMDYLDPPDCHGEPYVYVDEGCIEAMGGIYPVRYGPCTVKWINTYENGKLGVERVAATAAEARAEVQAVSLEWQTRMVDGVTLGDLLSSVETCSCDTLANPCKVYCPPACPSPTQFCPPMLPCALPGTCRPQHCAPARCWNPCSPCSQNRFAPARPRCRLFSRFRR